MAQAGGSRSPVGMLGRGAAMVAAVVCAWLVTELATRGVDVYVTLPVWRERLEVATVVGAVVIGLGVLALATVRKRLAADVLVVATAAAVTGLATVGLHGTRWGVNALRNDSAFRSEMALRYTEGIALQDYAYLGLHAYYPPALGWITGRVAVVFDMPAWEAMQPVHLFMGALVPLLTYVLWSKLLTPLHAAAVVALCCLMLTDLQKPDEWLVLACAVPWWLAAFRRAERDGVRPWAAWQHGIVAGLLLLTHTYFFMPLAVATVLGVGWDLLRRRGLTLPWRSALTLVAVGLLVSSVYWYGVVVDRSSFPSDNLQLRHTVATASTPPWPLPPRLGGILGLIGVVWLLLRARTERLAAALLLLLVAAYATIFGGAVLKRLFEVALLAQKVDDLVQFVYVVAATLAVIDALAQLSRWVDARRPTGRVGGRALSVTAAALAVVVVGVPAALHAHDHLAVGRNVMAAQTTRYPDGTYPEGRQGRRVVAPDYVGKSDASVEQVLAAWHRLSGTTESDDEDTVLVTTRVDLLATTHVHPFTAWKSIYTHPNGQFNARLALLREVAACSDSSCAAGLLRDNPYDPVDGLVLRSRGGGDLVMPYGGDNWPRRLQRREITWPRSLFTGPEFAVRELPNTVVIALR